MKLNALLASKIKKMYAMNAYLGNSDNLLLVANAFKDTTIMMDRAFCVRNVPNTANDGINVN